MTIAARTRGYVEGLAMIALKGLVSVLEGLATIALEGLVTASLLHAA